MKIYNDLKVVFNQKQKVKIIYMFLITLLMPFFEIIGIGSVPAFAILIIDLDKFLSILSTYISVDYLYEISRVKISLLAAISLVLVFIIKNLYLFLAIYLQGAILKKLKYEVTLKLFKHYINLPYIEHKDKDPAILIRIIQSDVAGSFKWISSSFTVIRESIVLFGIFLLLVIVDPIITSCLFLFLVIPLSLYYLSSASLSSNCANSSCVIDT